MTSRKLLFIVLDGISDRPCEELNGLTPLEAAHTPNLDTLAKQGKTGLMAIIDDEIPPETESAVLAMFGFDPIIYNTGRGPLEAYGSGLDFQDGDLITRCNFATLEENKILDVQAGKIEGEHAKELVDFLQKNLELESYPVEMKLFHTLNYRALLVLHSKKGKLSAQITNTHPGYQRVKSDGYKEIPVSVAGENFLEESKTLDETSEANISASLINEFTEKSYALLRDHEINLGRKRKNLPPANVVIARGSGDGLPNLDNFKGKNLRWLCIGDTPAERGIAKLLGMKLSEGLPEPECDKSLKTDEEIENAVKIDTNVRFKEMIKNFNDFDCFYFHLKGADPFGHRGMVQQKKKMIEALDKYFFKKIVERIDLKNTTVVVTTDHCTVCSLRAHTADPVPLLISGYGIEPDSVEKFGESFCKKGSIGKIKATELMSILMRGFK
jgi:2,3-bisphosphoglycerate-independent phosphoglycerate mutase